MTRLTILATALAASVALAGCAGQIDPYGGVTVTPALPAPVYVEPRPYYGRPAYYPPRPYWHGGRGWGGRYGHRRGW